MKALGGCTRSRRFSRLVRRRWHRPRSLVLSMLLLGLSIGICNAQTTTPTSQPREHVYLLRGFANVFSLGMDQIAAKLKQHGIHTTVDNYLAWPTLAEQAAAEYKGGQTRTIVLVGHSSGATAVTEMAARLSELGVPVKLAIGLDPTSHMTASGHVDRYVNYYIANGFGDRVVKGPQFSGVLQNVDLHHMSDVGHFNIDKDRAVQNMVMRDIQAALTSSPPKTAAGDVHGHRTSAAAKPGLVTIGTPIRD